MARKVKKVDLNSTNLIAEYKRVRKAFVERLRYWKNKTGVDLSYLKPKKPKNITKKDIEALTSKSGESIQKKAGIKPTKKKPAKKTQKKTEAKDTVKTDLKSRYKQVRKAYVERLRYYQKQTKVDLSALKVAIPKTITEASIRNLENKDGDYFKRKIKELETKERRKYEKADIILRKIEQIIEETYSRAVAEKPYFKEMYLNHYINTFNAFQEIKESKGRIAIANAFNEKSESIIYQIEKAIYASGAYAEQDVFSALQELNHLFTGKYDISTLENARMNDEGLWFSGM